MTKKEFRTLADPETVRETIADLDLGGATEYVDLREARGRVLAERVDAPIDVPGFDRAAMDGYAVQARDTAGADEADPAVLDLAGTVHAGEQPDVTVDAGTCAEVSTGAVLPPGADAVVVVEQTTEIEDADATEIELRAAVAPGANVMVAGADIAAGSRALGPDTELTPREIGLLSALGVDQVPVRRRPQVGIVSTGDELVPPGEKLTHSRGEIYDVNTTTIAAGVEAAGGEPVVYPHVGDDFDAMERTLRGAADECDLVLSSGSTSASAVDVIYRVIEDRGELLLHGAAVKPGKPMLVGRIDRPDDESAESDSDGDSDGTTARSAYVGLPGYPVSAMTIFRVFVAPAIRAAAGRSEPATATVEGRMAAQQRHDEGRLRLLSVGLVENGDGDTLVYPVDKGSGATTSLAEADGVVAIDADTDYLDTGDPVTVTLFSPDVEPPQLLGIGEADPALTELLDSLAAPRYLPLGSREGLRRLRNGVPDVAVVAGPTDSDPDAVDLGGWSREWGLVVPAGNPDDVTGVADLVDRELRFVNRETTSGLRTSLSNHVAALADERGVDRHELVDAIDGFDRTVKGVESPARRVADGRCAVGLGLRATADRLDLGFVSVGSQSVTLYAVPDRTEKAGIDQLQSALETLPSTAGSLSGYTFESS